MTKVTYILAVLCLLMAGFGVYGLYREHTAQAVLDAQTKANQSVIAQKDASNVVIAKDRDTAIKQLQALQSQSATPTQAVKVVTQYVQVPKPIYVYQPAATTTPGNATTAATEIPATPAPQAGDIIIPAADATAWRNAQLTCQENAVNLNACTATDANDKAIIQTQEKQISEDRVALKGGTKWRRALTALKWISVGAAVGAGAVEYHNHR